MRCNLNNVSDFIVSCDNLGSVPALFDVAIHEDDRGSFQEVWALRRFRELFKQKFEINSIVPSVEQVNFASNPNRGTLRGMHWQSKKAPVGKFVFCLSGCIQDIVVDVRRDTKSIKPYDSYGNNCSYILKGLDCTHGNTAKALWVPKGFAHGYLTLLDNTNVVYLQTDSGYSALESCSCDPLSCGLPWISKVSLGLEEYRMSEKDKNAPDFSKLKTLHSDDLFELSET